MKIWFRVFFIGGAISFRALFAWIRPWVYIPTLIVGPGDGSFRFTYWPYRIAKGGEILAPGDGNDLIQIIDARDLAEWTIRLVEEGTTGVFNAAGPRSALTMAEQFYMALVQRRSIGDALYQARKAIFDQQIESTWGAYQHYGDPDDTLLRPPG